MGLSLQTFPSTEQAKAALEANRASRYLGGGTLLVRSANEGEVSFSTFVRSTDPALTSIEISAGSARLGASLTMSAIIGARALAVVSPAARAVGGPAIRNMATIGGNLYAPAPYGDFTVALLALDATLEIDGNDIPIGAFLAGRDDTYARSIVRAVRFAIPSSDQFRFLKVSRVKPKGVSVLSICAVLEEQDGLITSARIAYGCMADRPMRAAEVEAALAGKPRSQQGIADALALATKGTAPITDAIASAWYRSEVLPVHLGRLLLTA
ncbi:FAD binding domain-containing protein [Rhizobiaceae bacterium n13]|uniref:FAD binding domain-containing protein n=1 Tax=Ferirhizobium litorale TaxID=2927786 RepID=A0AAE3QEG9_9HYPH|nr:FAD binding domain-containing protein [Fererhizobium litorale]MDI7861633.1 FAD binding domain-containing protein [Fererhizobium litorale]MDI7922025.1 FAD binding domain-containing protein [Fererhizobium litorale]